MGFSTNSAQQITKKDVSFMEVGIHENITWTNVIKNTSTNGSVFLEFTFTDSTGSNLKHTEFEPNKTAEDYNTRVLKQMSRILQILIS